MADPAWLTPDTTYQEYVDHSDLQGGKIVPCTDYRYGAIEWVDMDNKTHRDNDLPSMIYSNGFREWRQHGEYHRDDDLPAVTCAYGNQEWYTDGKRHRGGGKPAYVYASGACEWWVMGEKTGDSAHPPPGAIFPGHLTKSALPL